MSASEIEVRTRYFNHDLAALVGLANAHYEVEWCGIAGCNTVESGTTDQNGTFITQCPSNGESVRGHVDLVSTFVDIEEHTRAAQFSTVEDPCFDGSFSGFVDMRAVDDLAAHVFENAFITTTLSLSVFHRTTWQIFRIVDAGGSFFDAGFLNEINLDVDAVWGAFGIFSVAHEFGHALQYKALGGHPPLGEPCRLHFVERPESPTCAYVEGFADYVAAELRGPLGEFYDMIASGTELRNFTNDGSLVEGAIAATLLDLTDPADEAHDVIELPPSYVADIVEHCAVVLSFAPVHSSNIEWSLACFEQNIDPAITQSPVYFPVITDPISEFADVQTPLNWDRNGIRRVWKFNLYGESN